MTTTKLTKTTVDSDAPQLKEYELRDTVIPGFLLKVTPIGRKVFMIQYRTNAGGRQKPAIGRFGEITVEQARSIAQDWLAEVRKGRDPGAERAASRLAPTMRELSDRFIADCSEPKKSTSTVVSNRGYINRYILPALDPKKAREVARGDVAEVVSRMKHIPTQATGRFLAYGKCSTWQKVGPIVTMGRTRVFTFQNFRRQARPD